jgi:hypothetical protein
MRKQDRLGAMIDLLRQILRMWTKGDVGDRDALRRYFNNHNEKIRKTVPKDRLLEWTPGDGWDPICKFLDKSVPNEPFPNINKGGNAANMFYAVAVKQAVLMAHSKLKWPIGAAAVGWGAWWVTKTLYFP